MELKKYAKSDSEQLKGLIFLIGCHILLASFLGVYYVTLSFAKDENFIAEHQVSFQYADMQAIRQEDVPFIPPSPPAPPKSELTEIPNVVDTITEQVVNNVVDLVKVDENNSNETDTNNVVIDDLGYQGESVGGVGADNGNIFMVVEKMPFFPGGEFALRKYIAENVKYPYLANKKGIQGIVYIGFCVTTEGTVDKVTVLRGVSPLLDEEALRVVQSLPKWTPGEQRGKKVNVWCSVPINFQLN